MTDKTDNPEMIKVYKRLSTLLRRLEDMICEVEDLREDINCTYNEVNHIYNRLESIQYHQEEHKQHQCNQGIHFDFSSVKFTDEQMGQLAQKIMGQFKQEMLERDVPVNNHVIPQEEREILKRIKEKKN